jgi:SWI/SNF-related matrix-associated actin-dependent regulator 1 of chromatin subfamily A
MSEFSDCAVAVIGGMTADAKNRSVDAFQNDSDVRLFVGNIQAAGVGLTLTAASNVAFLELADGPEMLKQCEDRAHRIGQENAVNCWYLLAENTIDGKIVDLVEGKREVIDKITEEKGRIGFDLFELMKEDE